ncbi:uncharacterized protein CELE_T23F4.2 [Caenorhabditis elegans]|nr:Uncharacterized protein CELE_T23F4.2 [Caenorhabditis elegans]CUV67085.1 Uncharacterized protein CELE_T23F4.2 [Caenorhabditis elegans]|eukprot:NP_001305232.1 Uncharacterized protein CELE_T23F4.2 [Caenorhabditis elegans]
MTEDGHDEPNKLWEELFLRSFAHKIEQEISSPSPLEAHKNLNSELSKLNIQEISDKSFYRSTYSLVSPTRIENTDFEELERIENQEKTQDDSKPNRSNSSTERPSSQICSVFLPFIKTIKGNKKKNSITSVNNNTKNS